MSRIRFVFLVGALVSAGLLFVVCTREKPNPVETKQLSAPELMAQRQAQFEQSKRTSDPNGPKLIDRKHGEEARAEILALMRLSKSSGGASTMATETNGCWQVGAFVQEAECFPGGETQHYCLNFLAWSFSEDIIEYIDVYANMYWRPTGQQTWNYLDSDFNGNTCDIGAEISNTYDITQPWCGLIISNHYFSNPGGYACQITQACNTGTWNPGLIDDGCVQ